MRERGGGETRVDSERYRERRRRDERVR